MQLIILLARIEFSIVIQASRMVGIKNQQNRRVFALLIPRHSLRGNLLCIMQFINIFISFTQFIQIRLKLLIGLLLVIISSEDSCVFPNISSINSLSASSYLPANFLSKSLQKSIVSPLHCPCPNLSLSLSRSLPLFSPLSFSLS